MLRFAQNESDSNHKVLLEFLSLSVTTDSQHGLYRIKVNITKAISVAIPQCASALKVPGGNYFA